MAVRTRTIHEPRVVGGDAKIEEYLDSKGVQWTFHPRVNTDQFDVDKSLRNQARIATPLDRERVDQYAEAMSRGDEFPPVLAHGEQPALVIADGNHRLSAAVKARKPLAVYHISGDARTLVLITFEANTKHGLPTSFEERIQHALYLIDNGATIPEAAASLALKVKDVQKASVARATDERFMQANLPLSMIDKLTEPVKRRLSQIYTDEGFVAAAKLAADAAMSSGEVFAFVSEVNDPARRSSDKQVAYVEQQRADVYAERIGSTGGGLFKVKRTLTPKARIGLALGGIEALPEVSQVTAAYVGPERDEVAKRLRANARRLNEIAKALSS